MTRRMMTKMTMRRTTRWRTKKVMDYNEEETKRRRTM